MPGTGLLGLEPDGSVEHSVVPACAEHSAAARGNMAYGFKTDGGLIVFCRQKGSVAVLPYFSVVCVVNRNEKRAVFAPSSENYALISAFLRAAGIERVFEKISDERG